MCKLPVVIQCISEHPTYIHILTDTIITELKRIVRYTSPTRLLLIVNSTRTSGSPKSLFSHWFAAENGWAPPVISSLCTYIRIQKLCTYMYQCCLSTSLLCCIGCRSQPCMPQFKVYTQHTIAYTSLLIHLHNTSHSFCITGTAEHSAPNFLS